VTRITTMPCAITITAIAVFCHALTPVLGVVYMVIIVSILAISLPVHRSRRQWLLLVILNGWEMAFVTRLRLTTMRCATTTMVIAVNLHVLALLIILAVLVVHIPIVGFS